jgi:glycosyltransferase involved in cell wall biosynthesis
MKILYITLENLSLHKGSVVHVREIIAGLRKLGHEVGLIACSWYRFEKADRFYNLHKSLGFRRQPHFISSILLFIYLIKVLPRYDILYARDYHTVLIALIPRIIFNKRLVFEINGIANEEWKLKGDSILNLVISTLIRKAEGLAVRYSDRIVAVTPQIASYLVRQFYCPEDKVEVISNGVNTRIFHPIQDEASLLNWKKRLSLGKEDIVVTFIGNLAPWQGVNDLIQVAPALLGGKKNIRFLIIGDGVLKEDLEEEVRRLGISQHFLFTGMVNYDQIPFYINITDICVTLKRRLKSGYSPLKLYEYMACGKPVVASRVEGLEFIEAEGAGRLVEPGDLRSLERVLLELLVGPQKRVEMGQKGLQIVKNKFSWDLGVLRIEKILERLA